MSARKCVALVGAAAALFVGMSAGAQAAVTIINGSFESGESIAPGTFNTVFAPNNSAITGWTVTAGSIDYVGTYWQAADGVRSIDLSGNGPGTISQTLTGLTVNSFYTISFDLAGNPDGGPGVKQVAAKVGADTNTFSYPVLSPGQTRP